LAKKATTLSLTSKPYLRLKEILNVRFGKPISKEIDEFINKRLAELENTPQVQTITADEYETLKRRHLKLTADVGVIEKRLDKKGVYDQLMDLAEKVGLDFEGLSNVEEIAPRLLREWDGSEGDSEMFITLLETAREKRQVEHRLAEIRNSKARNEKD